MALLAFSPVASAQSKPSKPSNGRPTFVEVRLSLSESATRVFSARQFRRYLTIELDDAGHVAAHDQGPLADHVGYVWIDLPEPGRVLIEARVGRHSVSTRTLAIREGLRPDVAARLIAIATSEMIRSQARPVRVRKPKPPKPPTPEEVELATRDNAAFLVSGGGRAAWLPASNAWLGGSGLELSFRMARIRQHLSAAWMTGTSDMGPLRWTEVGLGVDGSVWLSPSWRVDVGAGGYAASQFASHALAIDDTGGERDAWNVRAAARLQLDRSLGACTWIGLGLEPGVLLRSVNVTTDSGTHDLSGWFVGMSLALTYEQRLGSAVRKL